MSLFFNNEIDRLKADGLFRSLRVIDRATLLNFCSNDYLGLAEDTRLVEAAVDAARRFGAGSGAARLISGNIPVCEELESELAVFKGTESALLFNSGYHANIGVIPALMGEGDVIFSDELNHASLIDGCRLSKAKKVVYQHNDLNHLEKMLKDLTRLPSADTLFLSRRGLGRGRLFIVTEAVFSMEGDLCPLNELLTIAEKYGAMVYLDEAHAVGVFGDRGQGLTPYPLPLTPYLVSMGTLGKAFGSYGAFVAGSKALRDYLINKARSFIFSTGLPPAVVGASLAALKIIRQEPDRRERLWENIRRVGSDLSTDRRDSSPFKINRLDGCLAPSSSPIFSIPIGDAKKTMEVSQRLFEEGIYIQGLRPPTVPEGTSRLRLTVMATHTDAQLERLKECLKTIF